MEEQDKKALETDYIASYHYSGGQKIVASLAVLIILGIMITGGTFLVVNIIKFFVK
jgi:hypothetical protein